MTSPIPPFVFDVSAPVVKVSQHTWRQSSTLSFPLHRAMQTPFTTCLVIATAFQYFSPFSRAFAPESSLSSALSRDGVLEVTATTVLNKRPPPDLSFLPIPLPFPLFFEPFGAGADEQVPLVFLVLKFPSSDLAIRYLLLRSFSFRLLPFS